MLGIAAFNGAMSPRFVEVPDPQEYDAHQVVCGTLQLGICGTDREILASGRPHAPDDCEFLVLGHECLAQVEAVGSHVEGFSVGDLVVPIVRRPNKPTSARVDMLPVGQYVERGIVNAHGFSTSYWLDEPEHLFRIDPALKSVAVLTEPLAVAAKAINEASVIQRARLGDEVWQRQPQRVLVTGMGPIGFSALIGARARNWPVTMYGRDPEDSFRARLAREFGAKYLPQERAEFSSMNPEADGFDMILECTGSEEVILHCATALASCGVMAWLGSSRTPQPGYGNFARLVRDGLFRNQVFVGSVNAARRDFQEAIVRLESLARDRASAAESLITTRVRPDDALWHFANREFQGIKTVVMYE